MSQTSIEKEVERIKEAGFPVKTGARAFRSESGEANLDAVASWLHRWAKNAAANYAVISNGRGIRFLRDSCMGMPAIAVGIGPSLDMQYDVLRMLKRRAIIIATDAAYSPLMANGVEPDLIISFDCKREQSTLWKGMPTRIPAVLDSCTHPDTIANWWGPKLYFNHWHQLDEFTEKLLPHIYPHLGQMPSAGTVGNMAVQFAMAMGCKKIAMVGMDLCYAKQGDGWIYRCNSYEWPDRKLVDKLPLYDNSERVSRSFFKPMGTVMEPDFKLKEGSKEIAYRTDPELALYAKNLLQIVQHFKDVEFTHCSTWNIFGEDVNGGKLEDWATENCKKEYEIGRTALWNLPEIMANDPKPIVGITCR